ncbi:MAG: hypothetical protein NC223_00970 [Butyrivibrio sp.]|nr:hypothetical protein [Butyrivibrio sp.]
MSQKQIIRKLLSAFTAFVMLAMPAAAAVPADRTYAGNESAAEASYSTDGGKTWTDVEKLADINAVTDYMTKDNTILRLNKDIELGSGSIVPVINGNHTTIDGQGHTISRGSCNAQMFTLSGEGAVTFKNIVIDGGALWDDASDVQNRTNDDGYKSSGTTNIIYIANDEASAILESGTILQNNDLEQASFNGAGVSIAAGSLVMKDGAVIRNCSATGTSSAGGGAGGGAGRQRLCF